MKKMAMILISETVCRVNKNRPVLLQQNKTGRRL